VSEFRPVKNRTNYWGWIKGNVQYWEGKSENPEKSERKAWGSKNSLEETADSGPGGGEGLLGRAKTLDQS